MRRPIPVLLAVLLFAGCSDIHRTITRGSYDGFHIGSTGPEAYARAQEKSLAGDVDPWLYADAYVPSYKDLRYYYTGVLVQWDLAQDYDSLMLDTAGFPTRPTDSLWYVWTLGYGGDYYDNYLELHFRSDTLFKMYRFREKTGAL